MTVITLPTPKALTRNFNGIVSARRASLGVKTSSDTPEVPFDRASTLMGTLTGVPGGSSTGCGALSKTSLPDGEVN